MILKAITCFCLLFVFASARPQSNNYGQYDNGNTQYNNDQYNPKTPTYSSRQYEDSRSARITRFDYDNDGSGTYNYNVEQSDGIYNDQVGEIENQGTDQESLRVYGHYAYPGPDGRFYYVEYVADKDGFRPAGEHIPKSASVGRVGQLGIPSAAIASLAGGGLG